MAAFHSALCDAFDIDPIPSSATHPLDALHWGKV